MIPPIRKLDLPIGKLDDWDLLQAGFEGYMEEAERAPGVNAAQILETEFPADQGKSKQIQRLKVMLSHRNTYRNPLTPPQFDTPLHLLEDALARIQNEKRLSQQESVRQLLIHYLETTETIPGSPFHTYVSWTRFFRRDFWEYLASLKIKGTALLPQEEGAKPRKLPPGEQRTLDALKQVAPNGLTVPELCRLTRKDALADETLRSSMDAWLKRLKDKGLVQPNKNKPKQWFFVTDCES